MRAVLCVLALLVAMHAFAIDTAPAFDDPALQARYEHINHLLRCLVCRSETIADSNAQLAADLRRQVKELIAAGKSDDEILKFMTDRFGEYVLYNPPVAPRTWILWAAPIVLLGGGLLTAIIVISRKSRLPDTDPDDPGLGAS